MLPTRSNNARPSGIIKIVGHTGNDDVPLTHEKLAALLGIRRPYASRIIQGLKVRGILELRRGSISVLDLPALQQRSCDCDEQVQNTSLK